MPLSARVGRPVPDPIGLCAVKDRFHVCRRSCVVNRAINVGHIFHHRMVAVNRVRADCDDHVSFAEPVMFRSLDRAERVADARNAEDGCDPQRLLLRDAVAPRNRLPPRLAREQLQSFFALDVVQTHDRIHVHHVVNPGYVLVADALNVVSAVAVVIKRRALDRFEADDAHVGPDLFEAVAGRNRPGAAHRRAERRDGAVADALSLQIGGQLGDGIARDVIVKPVIAHRLELIEDANVGIAAQFPGLVINLFDVRFDGVSSDHMRAITLDALEPLAAHPFRQDDDRPSADSPAHPRAADAVVAGARPDDRVPVNVHLAEEQRLRQHRIGRADIVRAGGKIAPIQNHDRRGNAGQIRGQNFIFDVVVRAAPRNVVKVDRIERRFGQRVDRSLTDRRINRARVEHLFECGTDNGFGHFAFALFIAVSINDARSPRSKAAVISSSGSPATRPKRRKDAYAWPELFQLAISMSDGSAFWRISERTAGSRLYVSLSNAHEDLLRSVHSIEFNISMKGRTGIFIGCLVVCRAAPAMTANARVVLLRTPSAGSRIASTRSFTMACLFAVYAMTWAASARCSASDEWRNTSRRSFRSRAANVMNRSCMARADGSIDKACPLESSSPEFPLRMASDRAFRKSSSACATSCGNRTFP